MAKRNQHAKQGFGIDDPQDAIHLGEGKRIRLEDVPLENTDGDLHVGHRAYNDERYAPKGNGAATQARFIVAPVIQWSGTGYTYFVSACSYELPGSLSPINSAANTKILTTANATNPRFDRFIWNELGNCLVIDGTPAENPIIPEVIDPLTQIGGQSVLVAAGTTEPTPGQLSTTTIYNENNEWAGAFVGVGSANFATGTPNFTGFVSAFAYAIVQNDYIEWTSPIDFNPATFDSLGMQLRLNASMLSRENLEVRFYNNANQAVSNGRNLLIDKSFVNDWQFVSINLADFTLSNNTARKIRFRWTRGNQAHAGFYLDLVQLQGGIVSPIVAGTVVLTGHVIGSGQTGVPIPTTITEKAISEQDLQTDPLAGTEHILGRLASGALVKIPASLLFGAGTPGADGREVELQNNGTSIQWRYIGDGTWIDLVALSAITGPAGGNGTDGADGTEIELQVSGTDLQWRYVGAGLWTSLFDFSALGPTLPTGGTTGQVLKKISATDGDATWQDESGGATLGAEPVQEKYTFTTGNPQTFVVTGTPNGRPGLYLNGQFIDFTFWTWNVGTKTATFTEETLEDQSKIVLAYYSNLTGTAITTFRENNTVLFDGDYISGINSTARTGNILFDFTGVSLGATTEMRHNDAGAFTFPATAVLMFASADISTTVDNYFMFELVDNTVSSEIVHVFHAIEGGV
jgi:hypothetical protein